MKIIRFYNSIFNIEHISYVGIQSRPSSTNCSNPNYPISNSPMIICLVIILLAGNELVFQYTDMNLAMADLLKLEMSIQNDNK